MQGVTGLILVSPIFISNINKMKKCCYCWKEKELSEFGICKKNKDWLEYRCKECKREYDRERYKKWLVDKVKKKEFENVRKAEVMRYIKNLVLQKWCARCWYRENFAALQFHHIDPSKKYKSISEMVRGLRWIEKIKKEIDKCEILCANCHSIETAKQNNWYKYL